MKTSCNVLDCTYIIGGFAYDLVNWELTFLKRFFWGMMVDTGGRIAYDGKKKERTQGCNMHRVFGTKENVEYLDREGAYLIPFRNNQVGVIKTPKGYFFLGGGLEKGESHMECLKRESIEESGYIPYIKGKLCSAETYCKHPTIGYFHPIQTYYYGELLEKVSIPTETDHILCWVDYEVLKGTMFAEMQNWALEQLSEQMLEGHRNRRDGL